MLMLPRRYHRTFLPSSLLLYCLSFSTTSHLDNIPTSLLANLLMGGILHRSHRVALQCIILGVYALVLGASLRFSGVNFARLGCSDLLVRLLLWLRRLAAGVGCGHFGGLRGVVGGEVFGVGGSVVWKWSQFGWVGVVDLGFG